MRVRSFSIHNQRPNFFMGWGGRLCKLITHVDFLACVNSLIQEIIVYLLVNCWWASKGATPPVDPTAHVLHSIYPLIDIHSQCPTHNVEVTWKSEIFSGGGWTAFVQKNEPPSLIMGACLHCTSCNNIQIEWFWNQVIVCTFFNHKTMVLAASCVVSFVQNVLIRLKK